MTGLEKVLTSNRALQGERKQVTVLFADLKGSMELIADRDPEEARALLEAVVERMMDAVRRYEGTVNNVMGDGIMALFGAPLAHEDHAVRACHAALQMQDAVRRYAEEAQGAEGVAVQIRVGLNSGEVVVGSISNDLRMDYTAVGQTTHLAARLEQMAAPGTILITPQTLVLARGLIVTNSLGLRDIKGLADPLEVHELVGAVGRRPQRPAETPFVGRQPELAHLQRLMGLAAAGRGQVVALVGDPGVGKSRLVREFIERRREGEWLVVGGTAVSHTTTTPYLPVVELLQAYFDIDTRDDRRTVGDKVTGKLLPLDRSFDALVPVFLDMLNAGADGPERQTLDPSLRRQQTLEACKRVVLKESQAHPVVLVFEDLQWFDSESLALLDTLVEGLPGTRILLIVTYRSEHEHRWTRKSYYTQLRIDPLSPELAEELLDLWLGRDVSLQPLKTLLLQRTDGNPFFLEENVRALIETGALTGRPGDHRLVTHLTVAQVPSTVNVVIAARIDRLPATEKRVLQCAAAIGNTVRWSLLAAICDLGDDELRRVLSALQSGEFLYETTPAPDAEYTFRHTVTHEVAYATLLHDQRRVHHRRIVEAIERLDANRLGEESERLAHHAVKAGLWDKAFDHLVQSGRKAAGRFAHIEALACFEQALEVLARVPSTQQTIEQAIDLRFELRQSCVPLRDDRRVLDHLRHAEIAAERISDQRRLGWVFAYRTNGHFLAGDCPSAVEAGQRALAITSALGDPTLDEAANAFLGQVHHWLGNYRLGADLLRRNLTSVEPELRRRKLPVSQAVGSRTFLAWCLAESGEFAEARAHADHAVHLAEGLGSAYALVHACSGAAMVHLRRGVFADAIAAAERAVDVCRGRDFSALWAMPASLLGLAYTSMGRADEAVEILQRAADAASVLASPILGFLGEAHLGSRRVDDALTVGTRALELATAHRERGWEAWSLRLLAEALARDEAPRIEAAEETYRRAMALALDLGMRPLVGRCHLGLGALYGEAGKLLEAAEHCEAAMSVFRDTAMPYWLQQAEQIRRALA